MRGFHTLLRAFLLFLLMLDQVSAQRSDNVSQVAEFADSLAAGEIN